MELILLIIFWCAWCVVHSAMISLTFTDYLKDKLGSNYRFYRLFYNITALITLIPLIIYSAEPIGQLLFQWAGFFLILQSLLAITVLALFILGAKKYDLFQLFGIRQIKSGNSHSSLSKTDDINTSGILSLTRHPWYLAAILFIWIRDSDIYVSTLVINIILTSYIVIGTILEEKKLIIEYGDNYRAYQEKVSMLFPFKWIASKLSS